MLSACGVDAEPEFETDTPLNRSLIQVVALGADLNEAGFRDVRGYGVDSQGRIWVGEYSGLIHVFDADGGLIETFDRRGQGPGEFDNILALDTDPARRRIVVREGINMKVLTETLEETARWPIPRVVGGGVLPGVRFELHHGTLIFPIGLGREVVEQDTMRLTWTSGVLLRADVQGTQLDTIAALTGGWSMLPPRVSAMSSPPTAGGPVWVPIDSTGVLVGDGHQTYAFYLLAATGDTVGIFERSLPREVLTNTSGPEFARGFVQRGAYDPYRREVLACRTQPQGGGSRFDPVGVDHFSIEGEYLGTLQWPGCPRYVSDRGTIFLDTRGHLNVPVVLGFQYDDEP
jgi:hypothetical protein